jgi:hypothetical protein
MKASLGFLLQTNCGPRGAFPTNCPSANYAVLRENRDDGEWPVTPVQSPKIW